jgi:hypothetical protein
MRKAVATSAHVITTNLSHVSQVSQPTMEAITVLLQIHFCTKLELLNLYYIHSTSKK